MMITLLLRCTCLLAAVGTSRGVLWVDKKLGREAQNWDPSIPLPGWSTSAPIAYNELLAVDTARFCVASTEVLRLPYALYSQNIDFEDFQELQVIGGGEGGFCTILTATMLRAAGKAKAQEQVIVKIAKDDHPQSELLEMQEIREIDILSKVDHPNIVRSLGHGYLSMAHAKEQGADIYLWRKPFIVLEHITGGNLQDKILNAFDLPPLDGLGYILRRQVLPVKKAVRIAKEMAEALMYLHEYYAHSTIPVKIIHRDMKPENIMLDESGKARLIDFSLAKVVPVNHNDSLGAENHLHEMYKGTSDIGMVRYMAPEVYRGEPYNEKVDVYSLCLVLWQMLSLMPPYWSLIIPSAGKYWRQGWKEEVVKSGHRPPLRSDWSDQVQNMFQQCWHDDPSVRMSARQMRDVLTDIEREGVHRK